VIVALLARTPVARPTAYAVPMLVAITATIATNVAWRRRRRRRIRGVSQEQA
jgi:hypothetical protein